MVEEEDPIILTVTSFLHLEATDGEPPALMSPLNEVERFVFGQLGESSTFFQQSFMLGGMKAFRVGVLEGKPDLCTRDVLERWKSESGTCAFLPPNPAQQEQFLSFADKVLWPVLHSRVPSLAELVGTPYEKKRHDWDGYGAFIQSLAHHCSTIVNDELQKGERNRRIVIIIPDYSLMLLPALLRETPCLETATIMFYLPTPFPSSELFRTLPVAEALIQSLTAANLVGFQTADSMRHFMSTCARLLKAETGTKGVYVTSNKTVDGTVMVDRRFVRTLAQPLGTDTQVFQEILTDIQSKLANE
jgi:trehalose-6-phosphate synthase